jgi:hypothetical protein
MATYKERIEDLIGTEMETLHSVNGITAIFDNAVRSVCKALPMQLVYEKGALTPEEMTASTEVITNKLVVHVERLDDNARRRACTVTDAASFNDSSDPNSIYVATSYTPVYAITSTQAGGVETLEVYPAPDGTEKAYVYHIDFAALVSTDIDTAEVGLYASTLAGVPIIAEQAIIYKAASDYLITYLNEAIQEDEDNEITQLINSQISIIKSSYMEELQRLGVEMATEAR